MGTSVAALCLRIPHILMPPPTPSSFSSSSSSSSSSSYVFIDIIIIYDLKNNRYYDRDYNIH